MKEIGQEKKQFFRLHIEQNIEKRQNGSLFQLRTNKWRFSTYDKPKVLNSLRLRGPLLATFGLILFVGTPALTRNLRIDPAGTRTTLSHLT